jgi:hypothetical protein
MSEDGVVPFPDDDDRFEVTIRVMRFPKGGYVMAETGQHGGPVQAVSTLHELTGALSAHLQDWDRDMATKIAARYAELNPTVAALPRRGLFGRRS